jgi:hypothetical protein
MAQVELRRKGTLNVIIPRSGEVREFIKLLSDLEYVYDNLYAWELIVEQAEKESAPRVSWEPRKRSVLRRISKPEQVVLPEDRLYLSKIEIVSPGWAEIIGALNPLETVRKYLHDRHTRRQDKEYRETAEAQRLALENERLRLAVVKDKVDLLRSLNIPEDRIRAALSKHIVEPLERLDRLQDAGLIESAKVIEGNGDKSNDPK